MIITIRNLQNKVPVDTARVASIARRVLSSERVRKGGEIAFSFVNDSIIRKLNLKYLGHDRPTDVIAFDLSDACRPGKISADIVISCETASANAKRFNTTPSYELYLYVVHGVLHILGYDDRDKRSRARMRLKEEALLRIPGLSFK
ncbi:MAG: rRNA maturation RNase YbeY [Candidatus Omnitrophota bacterium]